MSLDAIADAAIEATDLRRQGVLQGRLGQPGVRGDGEAQARRGPPDLPARVPVGERHLCYIRDARILALRLDAFEGHAFTSNQAVQTTTSASDTEFLTLTHAPAAVAHAVIAIGSFNTASTTVSGYLNVAKDGSTIAEWNREAPNAAGWQCAGLAQRQALVAVATTWRARAGHLLPPIAVLWPTMAAQRAFSLPSHNSRANGLSVGGVRGAIARDD